MVGQAYFIVRPLRPLPTAVLSEARTTLPESSSRPLPAKMAHSRNLAHASLETAVQVYSIVHVFSGNPNSPLLIELLSVISLLNSYRMTEMRK